LVPALPAQRSPIAVVFAPFVITTGSATGTNWLEINQDLGELSIFWSLDFSAAGLFDDLFGCAAKN
jgi:hypothetical protein